MKIGTEDKRKVTLMAVLLVIAIPLAIHSFGSFGDSGPAVPPQPQPVTTTSANRPVTKKPGIPQVRATTLDPSLRTDILMASQKIEYTGGERNIFRVKEVPVAIPKPIDNGRLRPPPPPPPMEPPKPPIPLIFYGFSNRPGEPKKAFLRDGDNIFVAVEGEVVERRYKIMKITNTSIVVEDILNNNQQMISLTLPTTTG